MIWGFSESVVENATLAWLKELGWRVAPGQEIAPETPGAERASGGDYSSVYDIQRAVEDGATVPISHESRLANLALDVAARSHLNRDFEKAIDGEEVERKETLKRKCAQLRVLVKRILCNYGYPPDKEEWATA